MHGLANLGNTCYVNAVVQALLHCTAFRQWVAVEYAGDNVVTRALGGVARGLSSGAVAPRELLSALERVVGLRDVHAQQDAHELMIKLIDALDDASKSMFEGKMDRRVSCGLCGRAACTREAFTLLPLYPASCGSGSGQPETPHEHLQDVSRCLDDVFKDVEISTRECDFCKRTGPGTLSTRVSMVPRVLILSWIDYGSRSRVRLAQVGALRVLHNACAVMYQLVGVVCHQGDMRGGHYVALCRGGDGWSVYDDDVVNALSAEQIQKMIIKPYLLVYKS